MLACLGVVLAVGAAGVTADAAYSGRHLPAAPRLQSVGSTPIDGERLSGPDRYATAAAVSTASFPAGAPVAFVATGEDFPDALTAAAAAGGKGPVLLVGQGGLPAITAGELFRLHPSRVVVVGGDLAIPASTLSRIAAVVPAATITRISGDDRYSTAAALSAASFPQGSPLVLVATGEDYPDALTAAAAAAGKAPVLLVGRGGLPEVTANELSRLHPATVVVVGGTLAVPSSTKAAIESLLPHADVFRASGPDRYATAANVASYRFPSGASTAYVATGEDFPDALTAAAAAGGRGPVLLVKPDLVPTSTSAELAQLGARTVFLVGGPYAVSEATMEELVPTFVSSPPTTSTTTTSTTTSTTTPTTTPTTTSTTVELTPTTALGISTTGGSTSGGFGVGTSTTTTVVLPPPPPPTPLAAVAVRTAYAQLGKPYAWAGAGPAAFDCSGLTAYAWLAAGVVLPHNAAGQAEMVAPVEPVLAAWAPGDLLFYDSPIDHVAIYVGNDQMIEAAHSGIPVRLVTVRTQDLVGAGRPEPGR